jgi:hypothetical protein
LNAKAATWAAVSALFQALALLFSHRNFRYAFNHARGFYAGLAVTSPSAVIRSSTGFLQVAHSMRKDLSGV